MVFCPDIPHGRDAPVSIRYAEHILREYSLDRPYMHLYIERLLTPDDPDTGFSHPDARRFPYNLPSSGLS